jgi:hypothetical protein
LGIGCPGIIVVVAKYWERRLLEKDRLSAVRQIGTSDVAKDASIKTLTEGKLYGGK